MPVWIALVMCLSGSAAQQSCLEVYPDETAAGLAMCEIRGEQLAAQWLEQRRGYRLDRVRCRMGKPFEHRQDI